MLPEKHSHSTQPDMLFLPLLLAAVSTAAMTSRAPQDTVTRRDSTPRSAPRSDSGSQTLPTVRIRSATSGTNGYMPTVSRSATRTLTPLRTVPQSVTVLGAPVLADLGMQSMARAVEYAPGVTMGQGEGHRDAPTIRGQSSTADFFVDGVRDDAQYLRDTYNVEQIELLRGPNAVTFGRGGGGGVINRVTRQAQWGTSREVRLETGSYDQRRFTIDAGQALTGRLAARVTGLHENAESYRQATATEKFGVNPTVALQAGRTLLRAGYERFEDRRTVDRGVPALNGAPLRTAVGAFFGDPAQSLSRASVNGAHVRGEFDNAHGLTIRSHLRAYAYDKVYANVYPATIVNAAGTSVDLAAYQSGTDRRSIFHQTDAEWRVGRGAVRQTLLVGTELSRQRSVNQRLTGYFDGTRTSRTVSIDSAKQSVPVTFRQSASDADNAATATVAAAFLQDQLSLGSVVHLLGGVRIDRFSLAVEDNRTGTTLSRTDVLVSPRVGVVITPTRTVSVYTSYSMSHLPSAGDQFGSLSLTTQALRPERFGNREVGVKWAARPTLELTGAMYRLERTNSTAPDPDRAGVLVQTGRQKSSGVELSVAGAIRDGWDIIGSTAVQRATITSVTTGANAGATVPLVPHTMMSLWNKFRVHSRVSVGAGVVHQGARYAAINNAVTLPSFTRVDGALFLSLTRDLSLQANVENALNARYYATAHNNSNIMPGAPRLLRVALALRP